MEFTPYIKKKFIPENDRASYSKAYKIIDAAELLKENAFDSIIKNIKSHLNIPLNDFNNIYQKTINNYVEFVQSLPNSKHTNFNFEKGQILLGLLRTDITLDESDNYSCPVDPKIKSTPLLIEKRYAIWQYAIFSGTLLIDLGRVISNYLIQTCKQDCSDKVLWLPVDGSMKNKNNDNTHYIYKTIEPNYESQKKKLNIIFARQIIPDYIFSWMYTEQDIFFEWLNLLEDEAQGSGTLHKLVVVSIKKLINEYMGVKLPDHILQLTPHHIRNKEKYHKDSFWKGVNFSLKGDKYETQKLKEYPNANEFLQWLKTGIKNKILTVNQPDSYVHTSAEGMFLVNPDIFLEFSKQSSKYSNWKTVYKQLSHLGVIKYSNDTNLFELKTDAGYKQGLVIKDPKCFFGTEKVPAMSPTTQSNPYEPIMNSTVFPTPREETGAYMRRLLNPGPKLK